MSGRGSTTIYPVEWQGRVQFVGPVERCIYCGEGGSRTDEHVLPLALDGQIVLRAASCVACAKLTNTFESKLLNGLFRPIRLRLRLKRRKRGRTRQERHPTHIEVRVGADPDWEAASIPLADHPLFLLLPQLPPCELLRSAGDAQIWGRVCVHDPKALGRLQKWMMARNVTQFRTPDFDDADFFRLLAKVAHGYTVSKLGLDNFRPLLLPLIRGEQQNFPSLIGGPRDPLPQESTSLWNLASGVRVIGRRPLAVVVFRLFGNFGAPTYEIVAGDFPEAQVQSHPSGGAHVITYKDLCIGVLEGSPAF